MIISKAGDNLTFISKEQWQAVRMAYEIEKGVNGKNYVLISSVVDFILHMAEGNSKTGENVLNFNLSIEYTCDHNAPCYQEGLCYAESGCYLFGENQCGYTENVKFYNSVSSEVFIQAVQMAIDFTGYKLFRYFTCGDIPNYRFIDIMVKLAKNNPSVRFWSYTKKYELVNRWIDENGELPENLVIIFSHWLNSDGTYYPMNNKHNLPTSEFIPVGSEEKAKEVTHICPCSDPSVIANCQNCERPCYKLAKGESMALLEHSTLATKARDKELRTAKEALKKAGKKAS